MNDYFIREFRKKSRIILYLCLSINSYVSAQAPSPETFRHISIDDGLSQNAVQVIRQDHMGYVWIGTKDGLNRYDGYTFDVFQHTPGEGKSLSDNFVLDIFEDRDQQLWISTKNGLNLFDRHTESFQTFLLKEYAQDGASAVAINAVVQDQKGNMWLAVNKKNLFRFPQVKGKIDFTKGEMVAHAFTDIYHLYPEGNHVWVGDKSGLYRLEVAGKKSTHFPVHTRPPDLFKTASDSAVTYIAPSNQEGFLWIGNVSGLCHINTKTGNYQFYPHHYEKYRYGWGQVNNILEDPVSGKLWVGTPDELMRFDPQTRRWEYFDARNNHRHAFQGTGILTSTLDRSGQIWFGTNGYGINVFDIKNAGIKTFVYPLPVNSRVNDFSIRALCKDREGNVWIGARVLYRWNRESGKIISFEKSADHPEAMGNTEVYHLMEDREGWIWIAGLEGLYRHRLRDSTVIHYQHIPGDATSVPEKVVFTVYEDSSNRIWVVTRNYIGQLNRKTGQFKGIKYRNDLGTEPSFVRIVEDQKGKFWMNSEIGLLHFDPETYAITTYQHDPGDKRSISSNSVRSICPDPAQPETFLWLGTAGGGLGKFDLRTKQSEHFTTADGLPDNVVYAVLSDEAGFLWMSTNKGLSRFDEGNRTFKNLDVRDRLQSNEFNSGAFFKSKDGELFFGGIKGLNYFFPDQLKHNTHTPNVWITGVELGTNKIKPGDSTGILQESIHTQKEIHLSYQDDIISFSFAAMDFTAPEKNTFRYMLEGWDKKWIEAGNRRTATYTNLPGGRYVLRVQGANNDGVWSAKQASIGLVISPPFWLSWWAKIGYVLILGWAVHFAYNYKLKRTVLKHQLALETIEKEKLLEMDHLKSRFFINISHEIRTPLTLILGPIEQLKLFLREDEAKDNLMIMERNVMQLLNMANQILWLSKLEMGKDHLREEEGDLVLLLRGLAMSCQSLAHARNITISTVSELKVAIGTFDHQKIEQIAGNLLSNAIKYCSAGDTVSLVIEDVAQDADEGPAKVPFSFAVKDTGPGIADEYKPHIFDRFYRVKDSYDLQINGTGIGLALVKELVELHQGEIAVKDNEGKGTVFRVSLPLQLTHVERNSTPFFIPDDGKEKDTLSPKRNQPQEVNFLSEAVGQDVILIIEDNKDVRALIRQILTPHFITVEAEDGTDGIAKAKEIIPDLIITDVVMPGISGFTVCQELTHNTLTSHIPIIMLTAKSAEEDQMEGFAAGADAYLAKPFKRNELLLRTRMLIERRQALQKKYSLFTPGGEKFPYRNKAEGQFVQSIHHTIEKYLSEATLDITKLADTVNMSERHLRRKFQAVFGQSPNQYIRSFRLRKAHELLRSHAGNVSEVCYQVGFNNISYFSKCFREEFDMHPSDFSAVS